MISTNELDRVLGATAYDSSGEKLGKVDQAYLDDDSGRPSWVTVNTGLLGSRTTFVPLEDATLDGDELRVAHDKDKVKNAPNVDVDQHLDRDQEEELYRYYGLRWGTGTTRTETTGAAGEAGYAAGYDSSADAGAGVRTEAATDARREDDARLTVSEERLNVGTETREAGRARLRKYTTTETERVDVPVTKEKLTVERTPVSGTATAGTIEEGETSEEITLREERAVVDKETVPVEEVQVAKERVTEQEQVSEEVRKEHADLDLEGSAQRSETRTTR